MLAVIGEMLASRKQLFKDAGVANLGQFEAKTKQALPVVVNVLDGYDNLSANDARKDAIDNQLLQLLREGSALGVYLVLSASRAGGVRMNMLSNISTKMCLYLNEESEVSQIMGRDRLQQTDIPGRGQVFTDVPTAIQFYLPAEGESSSEILTALEAQVTTLSDAWVGERPVKIPMVPRELTSGEITRFTAEDAIQDQLLLGLNKISAEPEGFVLFQGDTLAIFPDTGKQAALLYPFLISQIVDAVEADRLVVIDAHGTLEAQFVDGPTLYVGKKALKTHADVLKSAFVELLEQGTQLQQCIVINGMTDVFEKLMLPMDQVSDFLGLGSDRIQVIVLDQVSKVNGSFGMIGPLKENVDQILFGGDLNAQRFVDNLPLAVRKETHAKNVLHSLKDGELDHIVVPTPNESEG